MQGNRRKGFGRGGGGGRRGTKERQVPKEDKSPGIGEMSQGGTTEN